MKTLALLLTLTALTGCSGGSDLSKQDAQTATNNFSRKPTADELKRANNSRLPPP